MELRLELGGEVVDSMWGKSNGGQAGARDQLTSMQLDVADKEGLYWRVLRAQR